jgi:7-keto-8-aminopelargonate synthetase-like enzyme
MTQRVIQISQGLLDAGFWVLPIRPPTVPVGSDRLRVTITSEHKLNDIERLVESIALLSRKIEGWEA